MYMLIDFSRQVAEGSRSSWLQILGSQLIDCSPYIRYSNWKHYSLYNFLECVNESQINAHIHVLVRVVSITWHMVISSCVKVWA